MEDMKWYLGEYKDSHNKVEMCLDKRHDQLIVFVPRLNKTYVYKDVIKITLTFRILGNKPL